MKTTTEKYDVFSKVFAQLSGESQDKLVKVAHRLQRTHRFAKCESKEKKTMANKKILVGILVTVLVFGLALAGCDNGTTSGPGGTGGESDTWTNVTDWSQVHGTWKASHTTPVITDLEGIKLTVTYTNYTITFNATAKTATLSGTVTETFSGEKDKIDKLWSQDFKTGLEDVLKQQFGGTASVVTFNDKNHSVTIILNNSTLSIPDELITNYQINQNGTKLKADSGTGFVMILTKQ